MRLQEHFGRGHWRYRRLIGRRRNARDRTGSPAPRPARASRPRQSSVTPQLVRAGRAVVLLACLGLAGPGSALARGTSVRRARAAVVAGAQTDTTYPTYVALGDSYSAGEGLGSYTTQGENTCDRSPYAYTTKVLPQITSYVSWACSGARTWDMDPRIPTPPPMTAYPRKYPSQPWQVQTVGPNTEYMTLTAGGDDIGFSTIGKACAEIIPHIIATNIDLPIDHISNTPCSTALADAKAGLPTLKNDLETLYTDLLNHSASNSELVVLGYPRIFPASYSGLPIKDGQTFCVLDHYPLIPTAPGYPAMSADVGMSEQDAESIDTWERNGLNFTVQKAVAYVAGYYHPGRLVYADTYDESVTHNCLGTTPNATVAAVELGSTSGNGGVCVPDTHVCVVAGGTFHPTTAGSALLAKVANQKFATLPNQTTGCGSGTPPIPAPPLALASSYSDAVLADDPAAYYKFGTSGATDSSGNGNNGTLIGTPSFANGELTVDGIDQGIDAGDIALGPSFTVETWINTDYTNSYGGNIIDRDSGNANGTPPTRSFALRIFPNPEFYALTNGVDDFTGDQHAISDQPAADRTWHYLAATASYLAPLNLTTVDLYVDGQLVAQNAASGAVPNTGLDIGIGRPVDQLSGFPVFAYCGSIGPTAIYNAALTEDQIAAHYAAGGVAEHAAPIAGRSTRATSLTVRRRRFRPSDWPDESRRIVRQQQLVGPLGMRG